MSKPIFRLVDELPAGNLTTRVLGALDWVVPGQWKNITGFENTIRTVTGETDQGMIQQIGERSIALYNDGSQGYQRAVWIYQTVENVSDLAGKAALVNKVGEDIGFLSWLTRITPKADTTQAADFAIKMVAELLAFTQINGLPGDSIGEFVESLTDYRDEALMRMAAVISLDGLVPLGPDFLLKINDALRRQGLSEFEKNPKFQGLKDMIPGGDSGGKLGFIQQMLGATQGWIGSFVSSRGLTQEKVLNSIAGFLQGSEGKLDYVAAFMDVSTNYYEHTGIQSVARSIINRAVAEI
jgi:hypothetical protein